MLESRSPLQALADVTSSERSDWLREDLGRSQSRLRRFLSASIVAQEEIEEFRTRFERLPDDTPLPPRSLREIRDGRSPYLRLQRHLIELARRYEELVDVPSVSLAAEGIEPVLHARAVLVSFTAALTLYDNYLSLRIVLEDPRFRRLIADPRRGFGRSEEATIEQIRDLNAPRRQRRLRNLVTRYDEVSDRLDAFGDPQIDELQLAIEATATYRYARAHTLQKRLPSKARLRRERILDGIDRLGRSALGTLSEVFGNGIGLIETRKGKLWNRAEVHRELGELLEPLDMLLEKTPFRLTDKFIPGHFGHVAIWVGSSEQLLPFDLWRDSLFRSAPFDRSQEEVAAGRSVLEALRTGVQLSSLAEFLNVDDLAVLRPQGRTAEDKRSSLLRAFAQIGKQYDFNFEVQSLDRITCSELPYHVYPGVEWETEPRMGQITISPDQVASALFQADPPFRLLRFYRDGAPVDPAQALRTLQALLAS